MFSMSQPLFSLGSGEAIGDNARCEPATTHGAASHPELEFPTNSLSLEDAHAGLEFALEKKEYAAADRLLQHLAKLYLADTSARFTIFHQLLRRNDLEHFAPSTILAVLNLFRTSPYELREVDAGALASLLQRTDLNAEVKESAYQCLMGHLATIPIPKGVDAIDFKPPDAIAQSFSLLRSLLYVGDENKALKMFDALIEMGFIPPQALPPEDAIDASDIKFVILSSVAKASLHWGWHILASQLVVNLLHPKAKANQLIPPLAVQTLSSILEGPIHLQPFVYLKQAQRIIKRSNPIQPMPISLVRLFYDKAAQYQQGVLAEQLYELSLNRPGYTSPRGLALGWFITHLSKNSSRPHRISALAEDVVAHDIFLPPAIRANVISAVASAGSLKHAKSLWLRYSRGPDGHMVKGSSDVLISMLRAFTRRLRGREVTLKQPNGSQEERKTLKEDILALKAFRNQLLDEFEKCHHPMHRASHHSITTFVRACFILGRDKQGFHLMKTLLKDSSPDIYDVNVCLSGLASNAPRQAAQLLDGMVNSNRLTPNLISYATIIDKAFDLADYDLVDKMFNRVKTMDLQDISFGTMSCLLKALATSRPGETCEQHTTRLQDALDLAKKWMPKHVQYISLAPFVVEECLRANSPYLAYEFWSALVSKKLAWDDPTHTRLRQSIVDCIKSHEQGGKDGMTTAAERDTMLSVLTRRTRTRSQ